MLGDLVLLRMGRCGDMAVVTEAKNRFEHHCFAVTKLQQNILYFRSINGSVTDLVLLQMGW